jgi:hypothetical protein
VVVPVEEPVVVDEPEAVPGSELRAGVDVRSPRGAAEPPVELPPCTKPRPFTTEPERGPEPSPSSGRTITMTRGLSFQP